MYQEHSIEHSSWLDIKRYCFEQKNFSCFNTQKKQYFTHNNSKTKSITISKQIAMNQKVYKYIF